MRWGMNGKITDDAAAGTVGHWQAPHLNTSDYAGGKVCVWEGESCVAN